MTAGRREPRELAGGRRWLAARASRRCWQHVFSRKEVMTRRSAIAWLEHPCARSSGTSCSRGVSVARGLSGRCLPRSWDTIFDRGLSRRDRLAQSRAGRRGHRAHDPEHLVCLVREQREVAVPFEYAQFRARHARSELTLGGERNCSISSAVEEDDRNADRGRFERPGSEEEGKILADPAAALAKRLREVGGDEVAERSPQRLPIGAAELPARNVEEGARPQPRPRCDRDERPGRAQGRPPGEGVANTLL